MSEECPHGGGPRPNPDPADGPIGTWEHCTIADCPCGEAKADASFADLVARGHVISRSPIEDLIERSSFGTPGAKALRARTPPEVVERITRRIAEAPYCTRAEHMRWAKSRALEELPDIANAVASMLSDLRKHTDTEGLCQFALVSSLVLRDVESTRRWIEGFAE